MALEQILGQKLPKPLEQTPQQEMLSKSWLFARFWTAFGQHFLAGSGSKMTQKLVCRNYAYILLRID